MTYSSALFGQVAHPTNILQELLVIFNRRHKIKAAILSWLDSWLVSGHEWVWLTQEKLSEQFGCRPETVGRHMRQLVRWKILERRFAKR